jgi:ribosomal protein S18 acetylase RimI-like enzyme
MPHPSSPAFQLRPAVENDREFIWSLRVATMKRLLSEAYGWDESVQRTYADESLAGRIVLVEGRPVGVVTLKDWEKEVHLGWLALVPEVQGRGLGRALIRWAQSYAADRNKPLTLQVLPANPACALYRDLGFTETGRSPRGDVRMRWQCTA